MKSAAALGICLVAANLAGAELPDLVLIVPGSPETTVSARSLLGASARDVRQEGMSGDATVYRGVPLLEVLEKAGLDVQSMPSQRKVAPAIVVAQGRDGYTVVFSVGELLLQRSDPKVYLVSEAAQKPLPADQGPVRLIVLGQRSRSAYALAKIEVRYVAENKPMSKP